MPDDYPMQVQQQYDAHFRTPRCYHCGLVLEGEGVPIRIHVRDTKIIGGQFCAACALDPFRVV